MASKVLVVEDDRTLLSILEYNLEKEGYSVVTVSDGTMAVETVRREKPDIILLDVMLPGMSGFEVCRILHKETMTPILMLTARDDEIDKVTGLDLGADDYMTKPFKMRELLARIRALIRRSGRPGVATDRPLRSGDLEVDTARHCATVEGRTIELTPKEFELLAFLVKNPGILFTRQQLLEMVWGYDFAGDTRTVDVHMRWLREKIEADPSNPKRILTIRGSGYKLEG